MTWDTFDHLRKKVQISVKKLKRKYYTDNLYITDAVQICNSSIHYILQLFFLETEVETLGLGCQTMLSQLKK